MRAPGPRFAWWVIPAAVALSIGAGTAIALIATDHYVDADDIAILPSIGLAAVFRRHR
jgi:hypothetical protein